MNSDTGRRHVVGTPTGRFSRAPDDTLKYIGLFDFYGFLGFPRGQQNHGTEGAIPKCIGKRKDLDVEL